MLAKFRILSLDGGGSWALIQVMALRALYSENTKGHAVLKDFDLVAANSGGSIVLGGLIENLTLKELLQNYFLDEAKRRTIFSPLGFGENLGNIIYKCIGIAPKYSTAAKLAGLKTLIVNFGSTEMSALPGRIVQSIGRSPHFLICGFNYDSRRAAFFRSNLASPAASSKPSSEATLAEAINASSTAPVKFFNAPAEVGSARYWDGAVAGYNNPILAAVVEAFACNQRAADIQALSIGTASVRRPFLQPGEIDTSGLMQFPQQSNPKNDVQELAGSILDDPPDAASFIAHVALGQSLPDAAPPEVTGSLVRMSPMIEPVHGKNGNWAPPVGLSVPEFLDLANLDLDAIEQEDVLKIQNLADQWLQDNVTNQAIRSNSTDFSCQIGHAKFSGAKTAWNALKQIP